MLVEQHQEKLTDQILTFINIKSDEQQQISKAQQIQDIIEIYQKKIKQNKNNKNSKLAFGYVADQDIFVDAIQLMQNLGYAEPPTPKYHKEPKSIQQVAEVFAYFFSAGAGVELFVSDKNVFNNITQISKKIMKKSEAGGNALAMAYRSFKENVTTILGAELNEEYYKSLFESKILVADANDYLKKGDLKDIHLVLDYSVNHTWGNLQTVRSNRMYLNHDTVNPNFSKMDSLHKFINTQHPDTQVLALSGFQFQNERSDQEKQNLLQNMLNNITETKKHGTKIHIEMATITDSALLYQLNKYGIQYVDSIGMNEQELYNLIEFMKSNKTIKAVKAEAPDVNQLISDVINYLALTQKAQYNLNRIHFHTINMHMICSTQSDWDYPSAALAKSIIVTLLMSHEIKDDFTDFEALNDLELDYPEEIIVKKLNGVIDQKPFSYTNPISCWDASKEFQCCVAPNVYTKTPKRTCGLGDNISSTGLIYQKVNPIINQNS